MNKKHALAIALIFGSLAFAFWDVAAKLLTDWGRDENYSHGFLMVPLAAYVVWRERASLLSIPSRPSAWGLFIVAGSLLLLGAGRLGAELFLTRIALIGTLAGIVVFLWGFKLLRALAFPFLLVLLAIPIPAIIFNQITFPLQLLASRFGEASISACQIPVLREGNVIILANTTLEVAEACSGIRSLVSLLALAVIWGYLSESPMWLRWLLAAAAVPIAISPTASVLPEPALPPMRSELKRPRGSSTRSPAGWCSSSPERSCSSCTARRCGCAPRPRRAATTLLSLQPHRASANLPAAS